MKGESWLYIDRELAHIWDYFTDPLTTVTNTQLLFTAAGRPHADFLVEKVSHLAIAPDVSLASVTDHAWRNLLEKKRMHSAARNEIKAEAQRINPATTILITRSQSSLAALNLPVGVRTIIVDDTELLTNIEPAWRKLRLKINSEPFETALVNLGPARMFVLPRLAQVFDCRAIDVSLFAEPAAPRKPHLIRRIHGKMKRILFRR